jgi:hypothetical protein
VQVLGLDQRLQLAVPGSARRRHFEPRRLAGPMWLYVAAEDLEDVRIPAWVGSRTRRHTSKATATKLAHAVTHAQPFSRDHPYMGKPGRETRNIGAFPAHPHVDLAVSGLAGGQWAVFTLEHLGAVGLTAGTVRKRMAAGKLHRYYRGVYGLVPYELLTREGRLLAAVYACGPGAVLSHRSAAALHDLRRSDSAKIDVTVPGRSRRSVPGVRVHRSTMLADKDLTAVQNVPCTTVPRTLFDLAETLGRRPLERMFDQADQLEVLDLSAVNDQIDRNPTRPAAKVVREVLSEHYVGSTVTWSELEERFLAIVREKRLPRPS